MPASFAAVALLILAVAAHAADTPTVLAQARQNIEAADYRATGRLVKIDAGGNRTNYAMKIAAHWFPGVLRALVEIVPPPGAASHSNRDDRVRILLEMRPNGQSSIRIAHPKGEGLVSLPFEQWSEGLFGGEFSYEDFLESQLYWQNQTVVKTAKFGARDCDVLKSTPGAIDRTHYAEIQTWLDRTIHYPVYAEKTLKGNGGVKEFTYLGLRHTGGVWSASQVEAKTRGRAGASLVIIERGSAKANLTLKDFSPEKISQFEAKP